MNTKNIFMNGFKSKIGYSFDYKDLVEFEAIIDFYEKQVKKQKEVIDKAIKYISKEFLCYDNESDEYICGSKAIDILQDKEVSE